MDNVWKTFRTAKLGTSAAWALGVTALAAVLGQGVARAGGITEVCPTSPITTPGGSSSSSPPNINGACNGTQITGDQAFPSYWEFTWIDASGNSTIDANMTSTGTDGSFNGTLELLDNTGNNVLASTGFYLPGSVGSGADPSISYNLTNGTQYILGLTDDSLVTGIDPSFTITYSATPTPEPASLGLFGGALATLAAFRKRRKVSR